MTTHVKLVSAKKQFEVFAQKVGSTPGTSYRYDPFRKASPLGTISSLLIQNPGGKIISTVRSAPTDMCVLLIYTRGSSKTLCFVKV